MKRVAYGALISLIGLCGYAYGLGTVGDPLQEKIFDKSCHHHGPRGHRGHRGHIGPRGHRGEPGIPGTGSTAFDRAFLLDPNPEQAIIINPGMLPMVVPVNPTDLNSAFFNPSLHAFIVPESGVYRIDYFLKAFSVTSFIFGGAADAGGLVMGVAIDDNPIGIRKLPLGSFAGSELGVVWGTHRIFVRLNQGQKVQLVVLATPRVGTLAVIMEFIQTGHIIGETSYLSVEKVAP